MERLCSTGSCREMTLMVSERATCRSIRRAEKSCSCDSVVSDDSSADNSAGSLLRWAKDFSNRSICLSLSRMSASLSWLSNLTMSNSRTLAADQCWVCCMLSMIASFSASCCFSDSISLSASHLVSFLLPELRALSSSTFSTVVWVSTRKLRITRSGGGWPFRSSSSATMAWNRSDNSGAPSVSWWWSSAALPLPGLSEGSDGTHPSSGLAAEELAAAGLPSLPSGEGEPPSLGCPSPPPPAALVRCCCCCCCVCVLVLVLVLVRPPFALRLAVCFLSPPPLLPYDDSNVAVEWGWWWFVCWWSSSKLSIILSVRWNSSPSMREKKSKRFCCTLSWLPLRVLWADARIFLTQSSCRMMWT
mmetsp:Transcript_18346/g.44152  ORF Transcript_18346/g.44152 Transcript_18346/m.44152 type:complete len:360 (-) Transcript_18346:1037-2116(-)